MENLEFISIFENVFQIIQSENIYRFYNPQHKNHSKLCNLKFDFKLYNLKIEKMFLIL